MNKLCLLLASVLCALSATAAPPGIVTPPQSATVNNGAAAAFTVIATNAATYQWYFQGTNLLDGATNATLTLDDVSTNGAGSYTVVVTSSDDSSVSNSPPAVLDIVQGTIIQWTISTYPGGGSNSFLVQLFDHDKPGTVANFIHYVASGALSNTFFDTDSNYVLQGGDYATPDRGTNHLAFENLPKGTNIFPAQINSEFSLGAVVPNTFGTLAARESGQRSASTGSFFFNLTDNTSNLDAAGYTVFGRILDGSNTLQYFTTLSLGNGLYSNSAPRLNVLPVNYSGTNKLVDADLYYCDFQFVSPSNAPVEAGAPVVAITSPAPNAAVTNGFSVTVRGTAQDSFALADVYCVLSEITGVSLGATQTNYSTSTTNWSVAFGAIQAGIYQITAYAQDASGTLSAPVTQFLTNQAILTIITNIDGRLATNTPIYLTPGQQYSFTAPAITGETFVDWQVGGTPSLDPVQAITAAVNLTMEVTYASNPPPGFAMASPAANSTVQAPNGNLTISGTVPSSTTVTQLTVQLFSQSNSVTTPLPAVISGTNWSLVETNLVGGPYLAVAAATGPSGQVGLLEQSFTALTGPPVILSGPQSSTNNVASAADFSVTASNTVSYQWQQVGAGPVAGATSATLELDNLSSNQSGFSYQVVLTAPDGETTSSTPAVLTVVPGVVIQWTISTYPDGSSNSFLVELFDHDKPATVENFLHYVTSGIYSNMFFDRDVTNFVLQGGDYATDDRSSTNLAVNNIVPGGDFPVQVDSEFNAGPLIHNEFGTLAMALQSGNDNSANTAFFFNLVDNSASLDVQDFTVFGRILTGSNVLQYFNTLSAPTNGIYAGFSQVPTLPVNYDGSNAPTDANFFYSAFTFISPSTPPVDTNIPAVSISYPLPNAAFTNAGDLTAAGTAQGPALAEVFCVLNPLTGLNAGEGQTNAADGTLDWSLDLGSNPPGVYQLTAYAIDGGGNLSAPAVEYFTNLMTLTIITNDAGALSTNVQYLLPGPSYSAVSAPTADEVFVNWTVQGTVSLNPVQTFTLETNVTLEITYASTNFPPGLAITSPAAGSEAQTTNAALTISGTIPSSVTVTEVTVQLFANSNAVASPQPAVINGTNWSLKVSSLAGGPYLISVTASDTLLQEGFVSENFTALIAPPVIVSLPQTVTVNAGSSAALTVVASNTVSYQWQLVGSGLIAGATSSTLVLNDVGTNQSDSTYQVVLESKDTQTVTSPPVTLAVESGTIIQLTISQFAGGASNTVQVELFDHDKPATVGNFIHYIASGAYSNMFFDTDSNYVLQGGDYVTLDRATNRLLIENLPKGTNIFPALINSEFSLGAVVPNTFGTLASRASGQRGANTGGFFMNLTDNTTNLDAAGYTVFGRILDGSNTLQYFTTLSATNGLYSNASPRLNVLPVNNGTNKPTDANLFYCDFQFISPSNAPVEAGAAAVSITSPAPNAALTNGYPVTVAGTAQDSFALADVYCVISSIAGAFPGEIQTNYATGTTNWSVSFGSIQAGVYEITAYAQDASGALSAPVTQFFTNQAILTIITNIDGLLTTNTPIYLTPAQQYTFTAPAISGETFVDWQVGGAPSLEPVQTITAGINLALEVTYASNAPGGLAMTSPAANSTAPAPNGNLTISGSIPSSTTVTQLTVQLFSQSTSVTTALPAVISGTNWSLAETNLVGGPYLAVVVASGPSGQVGLLQQNFTALTGAPIIISQPQSVTDNIGSSATISVGASNTVSYQWEQVGVGPIAGSTNASLGLNDLSSNQSGASYQVVLTAPDGETLASAPAVLTVVQGTIIQCTVSMFPGGGSNSFLVELFDQDKPATVENFIHYISSGAFSNTFFDTDVTNSALLGGDLASADRLGGPLNVHLISPGPGFPQEIESEFNVGPYIPNGFGTLASFSSANPDYGPGAFIFNLTNNSPDFDFEGYAVFGRIISGTNVLQYFNGLSLSNGLYAATNNLNLPLLPVNYNGTNAPADSNLFYCDFKLISPSNAPVDTNIPTVSLTFPATNAFFTNLSDLTVTGTASGAALAEVYLDLTSLEGASAGESGTNDATGTTNWSLDFGAGVPGIFELTAYAEDGGGNVSKPVTVFFTNMAQLVIITNIGGQFTTNGPQYLIPGSQETITAAPGAGQQFYNWTVNGVASINPVQKVTLTNSVTLVVTYLAANSSSAVTISSPAAGKEALAIQSVLSAGGSIGSTNVTQLTCQFFVQSNAVGNALPAIINGTNWSLGASNLANGSYAMVAAASSAAGPLSSASVNFTLTNVEMLTLRTNGQGTIVNTNSYPYLTPGTYTVKAAPAKGYAFYDWYDGVNTSVSAAKTFFISSNTTLTATFVPNDAALTGISITYPPANAMLTNGTFKITGTLPHAQVFTQMTCQLFLQSNSTSATGLPVTISSTGTSWSLPVTNIVAGPYNLAVLAYDTQGNARLVSSSFNLLSKLTVNVQGLGTVTAGLNGKYLQVGKSYAIVATPKPQQIFAYWTGGAANSNAASTAFTMSTNMVLTATFTNNPFPAVAGTYSGLFLDPAAVSPTNAGYMKLTVSPTGGFSGSLMFPSITYPVSYGFPYNGQTILPSAPNIFDPSNHLQLALSLDLTNGTDTVQGYLADQDPAGNYIWVSGILLNRNVTKLTAVSNPPAAGHYVLLAQPAANEGSSAAGYGAESILSTGALTLTGALPDNAALFEAANLSKNGAWPVYIVPATYAKKGMVIGWQTNLASGAVDGQLFWYKPGVGAATNLAAANLVSDGAVFTAPAANSQYQMVLDGGATYALPVNKFGHFVAQAPITSITLQTTGLLTGAIESNKTSLSFKGAFVSPSQGGAGYVIEAGGHTAGFQIMLTQ